MDSAYDLAWKHTSLRSKLLLIEKSRDLEFWKIVSDNVAAQAQGHSALSSTYYSVAGTGVSKLLSYRNQGFKTFFLISCWLLSWFPLVITSLILMKKHSDKVEDLLGKDMSADQCDVRQSILFRLRKYDKAIEIGLLGLSKMPLSTHTEGLLHSVLAKGYIRKKETYPEALNSIYVALKKASETEAQQPLQASRIYKHIGDTFLLHQDNEVNRLGAEEWYKKSSALAKKYGAMDQTLKHT